MASTDQSRMNPTNNKRPGCWSEGNVLVVPHGGELPPRCVKCNQPAEMGKPTTFSWHNPGWYVFILFRIVAYAVVALLVFQRARIAIGLCERHRAMRHRFSVAGLVLLGVAMGMTGVAVANDDVLLGAFGLIAFTIGMVLLSVMTRMLHPVLIDKDTARLGGCGAAFLASVKRGQM